MTRTAILCAVIWLADPARCQDQGSQPTFRAGTELIQVSVIAQDKDGKAVTDLKREDFQIFDNGAPQPIRLFLSAEADARVSPALAPGTFSNNIASGGRGGYAVLLFDNVNIDSGRRVFGFTAHARQMALQALQEIPPGDRIAIYSLGCKFQVVREFTSDRESLLRQLQTFAPAADSCFDPSTDGPEHALTARYVRPQAAPEVEATLAGHQQQELADIAASINADITDNEIRQLAEHLAGIPGRKNLIWLTTTFRLPPTNLQKFLKANVAVYPVDTRGSIIALESQKKTLAAPLLAIASQTGGVAFFDRDDLNVGIRDAMNDGRLSYTLGFYQTAEDKPAAVHRILVRVNRPDIALRYRTSYTIEPPQPASTNPVHDLVLAMNRPVDATAIGMTAAASRTQELLDLSVDFEISGLDLDFEDGLWKGRAELVARFLTAEGAAAGETRAETMTFNLRPATYASMLEKGAHYHKEIAIPAKAVELKLLVGSLASGRIGTLTIPLSEVRSK